MHIILLASHRVNPYFGGKKKFEEMMRRVREHEGGQKRQGASLQKERSGFEAVAEAMRRIEWRKGWDLNPR